MGLNGATWQRYFGALMLDLWDRSLPSSASLPRLLAQGQQRDGGRRDVRALRDACCDRPSAATVSCVATSRLQRLGVHRYSVRPCDRRPRAPGATLSSNGTVTAARAAVAAARRAPHRKQNRRPVRSLISRVEECRLEALLGTSCVQPIRSDKPAPVADSPATTTVTAQAVSEAATSTRATDSLRAADTI